MNLEMRISALEAMMPRKVDNGRLYDALKEIERCTAPLVLGEETQEQWDARFIQSYGSREQFISEREQIRKEI